MTEWIDNVVFWHWWILAGLLLIIELTVPAFFFLWLGIAAGATGLIVLVFPDLGIESQLVLFAILSIVAVIAWRRYREISVPESDQPHLFWYAVSFQQFPISHIHRFSLLARQTRELLA